MTQTAGIALGQRVPEGQTRIAQRFSVGTHAHTIASPDGTAEIRVRLHDSYKPNNAFTLLLNSPSSCTINRMVPKPVRCKRWLRILLLLWVGLGHTGFAANVAEPRLTIGRGLYFAPVDVTVWTPTPQAILVTTMDGSTQNLTNG